MFKIWNRLSFSVESCFRQWIGNREGMFPIIRVFFVADSRKHKNNKFGMFLANI